MQVVINRCCGGLSLSLKGSTRYAELSGFKLYPFIDKIPLSTESFSSIIYIAYLKCLVQYF